MGERSSRVSLLRKRAIWDDIAAKVNAVSKVKRNGKAIKKRWYDMRKIVWAKYLRSRKGAKKNSDGESILLDLSPAEQLVLGTLIPPGLEGVGGVDTALDIELQENQDLYAHISVSGAVLDEDPGERTSRDACAGILPQNSIIQVDVWTGYIAAAQLHSLVDQSETSIDSIDCTVPQGVEEFHSAEGSFYPAHNETEPVTAKDTPSYVQLSLETQAQLLESSRTQALYTRMVAKSICKLNATHHMHLSAIRSSLANIVVQLGDINQGLNAIAASLVRLTGNNN